MVLSLTHKMVRQAKNWIETNWAEGGYIAVGHLRFDMGRDVDHWSCQF
jgi:hypothetical protein